MHTLKQYNTEFNERQHMFTNSNTNNLTPVISNIIWTRQILNKLGETDAVAGSFLRTNTEFKLLSSALFEDLCKFEKEQFDMWVEDMNLLIGDDKSDLTLQKTGKLMELDIETGKLKVNYGSQLVTLLREVRQLISMGFPVPPPIQQVAENGQKFYRHGVVLQQVANFYNTIDQQMLPCQQSMMLGPALEFEKLIRLPSSGNNGSVTWENPKDLEIYVAKLQASADKLTTENRKLRKYHNMIVDHILNLLSIDLVKHQYRWKDEINSIRSIIDSAMNGGIRHENTLTWRNHWDYQLYKALEFQYQLGLESLSENLPEAKVEIIYKNQKLQFRPSFEEIKAKYFREMKKFINLPTSFKPLGETDIFACMVGQNSKSLMSVYQKADSLFQSLNKVLDVYKDWVILSSVDLDAFVEEALGEVSDWEMNFKILKQKGKEVEQLPITIKIDCITISAVPVKAAIDDHLQRLFDALLGTLKRGASKHLQAVEQFTTMAMELLLQRPQSMIDIGNANAVHSELSKNKLTIESHFEELHKKNKLLKSVSGASVDSSMAKAKWSKLELMLESHELMIKEQVDMLRGAIESRIHNLMKDVEKFGLRWNQLKPKTVDASQLSSAIESVSFINERISEFAELENVQKQIYEDCGHFGVERPSMEEMDLLKEDLIESQKAWSLCQEYVAGIQEFACQDWITSRGKSSRLEEYLMSWNENLRSRPIDTLSSNILKDIDSYRGIIPNLKYVRGDTWMSEHWGEFFRIVSMPKGVTLPELTFGHLLDVRASIVSNIRSIVELNGRADGEVAIRQALQELDIWGAGASFSLIVYEDIKGDSVKLIKEWKETLTQVGDNQSLLQSLKDSPFYKNFHDKASSWETKLAETDEYLRQLNNIQRKWVYLEPIFSRGALPSEQARFSKIDDDFRSIMKSVATDSRVVSLTTYPGIKHTLSTLSDQLDRCQKALNEFLENKRVKFARFYFLGDDDLLEILGQSKNPEVIQTHLKKLFAGVHSVIFNDTVSHVIGMKSIHGEEVSLRKPVQISDEVETWLESFSSEMKSTLRAMLLDCLKEPDIFKYPSQIVGLAEYLHFTGNVEEVIKSGSGFKNLSNKLRSQLESYTSFDVHSIENPIVKNVTELKIKSLILDIIHFIDVLEQLECQQIKSISDWSWKKQIRFYLDNDKNCIISMNDAQFDYSYEYQGIPPKLVHTPLTDKCYLTLTQAMSSGFGGNPFGPAVLIF
jgi:dynein heavy chain 2